MAKKPTVYKNYINGEWVVSATKKTFANINPADTAETVGYFQDSDERDVNAAVAAAKEAFKKWRLVPAPKRAELVMKLGLWLKENKERLAQDATREMGKVLKETRGDVQEGIDMAFFRAGEGRRLYGDTTPRAAQQVRHERAPALGRLRTHHAVELPHGHPHLEDDARPRVRATPSSSSPPPTRPSPSGTSSRAPRKPASRKGVVNFVTGSGRKVGDPLSKHRDVPSSPSRARPKWAATSTLRAPRTFKRVRLEMGGKNAVIVMDDANLELALDGVALGRLRHDRPALHGHEPLLVPRRASTRSSSTCS